MIDSVAGVVARRSKLVVALVFRLSEGSATLGVVTVLPVLFAVSWLVGTMTALSIPFTLVSALVGSIAVGIGYAFVASVFVLPSLLALWAEYGPAPAAADAGATAAASDD